jgi:hypothetical protein
MSGARTALVIYLLRTVLGDRAIAALVLLMVAGMAIAAFVGSTALVEQRELATVFTATACRLAVVIVLTLVTCFHVRRAFEMREVDLLLSRPISRGDFVAAHVVTLLLLAAIAATLAGAAVGVVARPAAVALGLWTLALLIEAAIVAVAALFFALSLPSGVASALACFGLYVLARLIGLLAGIAAAQSHTGPTGWLLDQLMTVFALLLPRLDLLAQSAWLVHGAGTGLGTLFAQGAVYVVFLAAAARFDLGRRQL